MMNKKNREEQQIFSDLETLSTSPGYAHAIAYFCFRDNIIQFSGSMTVDDMLPLFSWDRLIRTEISTLIGLMLKSEIDISLPSLEIMQNYITNYLKTHQ